MTSSRPRRRARAAVAFGSFVLAALPGAAFAQRTAADLESARQLYNQGMELRDKGDAKGALEKFRAAHALGNTPLTGIELCKTHAAMNQPVEAREVCLGVARIPPLAQETTRSQEARTEAGRIAEEQRSKMGALRITVKGVPAGMEPTVTVDGVVLPAAALGEPRAVNPGAHVLTARVGQGVETRATLETRAGESRDVEMGVQPPPPGAAPAPAPASGAAANGAPESPPPKEKSNAFPIVMFGTAAVAGGIGLVTGLIALTNKSSLDDDCPQKNCARDQWDSLDSARAMGTTSTVSFIVAGVALGVGLLATVTSNKSSGAQSAQGLRTTPVAVRFGGAGVHGTF